MSKFCTNCGKKQEEGIVCDCTKKTTKAVVESSKNEIVESLKDIIVNIFVKPISTITKYSKSNNFNLGLILIGICALVQGIFAIMIAENVTKAFSMGLFTVVEIDKLEVFINGALYSILYYLLLVLGTFVVVNKIFKVPTTYKRNTAMIGVVSVISTVTILVSMILYFVSFEIATIVLILGNLLSIVTLYHSIKNVDKVEDDKMGITYISIIGFVFIGLYLINLILN